MEEAKNILYHFLLNNYLDKMKNSIIIDENISKKYQMEILYKKLRSIVLYNVKKNFEIEIRHHTVNEYNITMDDIKKCIQKCFMLKDYEIEFIKNTKMCKYNDFIWFKYINISYFDGSNKYDPSTTIIFNMDIDAMIKILRYRNSIINIQRNFLNRLYTPPNGIFLKKEYLKSKKIIRE